MMPFDNILITDDSGFFAYYLANILLSGSLQERL